MSADMMTAEQLDAGLVNAFRRVFYLFVDKVSAQ